METPKSIPQITKAELLAKVAEAGTIDREKYPMIIIGVRGYYKDTLGKVGSNDIGIYDDAIFIDTPHSFASFNGNVDPSTEKVHMANLKPGIYYAHRFGLHKGQYLALIQTGGEVTVERWKSPTEFIEDTGYFGINIHKGGFNSTSSLGCQTVYPAQYDGFIGLAKSEAVRLFTVQKYDKVNIPYVLLDFTEPEETII